MSEAMTYTSKTGTPHTKQKMNIHLSMQESSVICMFLNQQLNLRLRWFSTALTQQRVTRISVFCFGRFLNLPFLFCLRAPSDSTNTYTSKLQLQYFAIIFEISFLCSGND